MLYLSFAQPMTAGQGGTGRRVRRGMKSVSAAEALFPQPWPPQAQGPGLTLIIPSPCTAGFSRRMLVCRSVLLTCQPVAEPSCAVVFRGPHDRYEKLPPDQWRALPVVSVPPARWPKLTQNGTKYSFASEREMVKDKIRGALRICAYTEYASVVIGDYGLGNGYRNPPQELAELWREVLLYDPDLRGRIRHVAFVFEDPSQSTTQLILDDLAKKSKNGSSGSSSKSKSKSKSSSAGVGSSSSSSAPTDYQIFAHIFNNDEIQRVLSQPDSRYGLSNLLAE